MTGDAVVGAEHRPKRQRGVAQLHRQLDVLGDVEPESAPFLGDGVAEQAHVLGLVPQIIGHPVGGQDFLLARDDDGADELPRLREDLLEVVVVDFSTFVDVSVGHVVRRSFQLALNPVGEATQPPLTGTIIYEI